MRLLLDTHIWLWSRLAPGRLGKRLTRILEEARHEFWLSPLSLWEAQLLSEKGRISLAPTPQEWITAALEKLPMKEAPLTFVVAQAKGEVRLSHGDPIDQMLAATARAYDLTLVTADKRLLDGSGFSVLANL